MAETKRVNPFMEEYNTPFGTIPFDKIKNEDYMEALRYGIKREKEEVDAIIANEERPTFENTILALENCGRQLEKVQYPFYNMLSAESNDTLQRIAEEIAPEETELSNYISMNAKLFDRVKKVYDERENLNLDSEDMMLLEETYKGFVRSGANLNDKDKKEYGEISKKLNLAQLKFGQNLLKATNAYEMLLTEEEEMAGLPDYVRDAAKERAEAKGKSGWLIDLSFPSYSSFMKYSDRRDLRHKLYMANNTKAFGGEYDNQPVVKEIVNLRLRKAELLGYKDIADYKLEERMAENASNVYGLLDELLEAYKPVAEKEVHEIEDYAKREGMNERIEAWDWSYYSRKLKEEKYSINDSIVKPYFELGRVKEGVFGLATQLYGLKFVRNTDIPVYHKDVEAYEVYDDAGKMLSILYTDFYPRAGKQGGAWMTEFKQQWKDGDKDSRPQISLVMNFTKPIGDEPALLTFDELTTFLHEFGHSLHGMMANSKYASLSGTNVKRDFVEMPSQLMENWAYEKEFLDRFAVHYKTNEKIPEKYIENIRNSQNFNVGYGCVRQLSFGYLDMAWHTITENFDGDVEAFEKEAWKRTQVLPDVAGTCMSVNFGHIFNGGYMAGYYGYKWAEVLDADVFSVFKKNGIFDKATARRFRKEVLEKGGTVHPMTLYKNFMGREPKIDALLERSKVRP